jgi:hypothetical protein
VWSVSAFILFGGATLLWVPQFLLDNWLANQEVDASAVRLAIGNAAQAVLFSLGGVIAVVGVGLSLARHRLELEDSRHGRVREERRITELEYQRTVDAERELRTRFTQAVALLSDPGKATTRQAGVYAIGALADDWAVRGRPDERQVCIDVLCGYLRSYWDPQSNDADDERRIRGAAFDLIAEHHRPDTGRLSWDAASFNIRDTTVDFDIDFHSVTIANSHFDFTDATFSGGTFRFDGAKVSGGSVLFKRTIFSGGKAVFNHSTFSGGEMDFDHASFSGGDVHFNHASFSGTRVHFNNAGFSDGDVWFHGATFTDEIVLFNGANFSGATVWFQAANFPNGGVMFNGTSVTAGSILFNSSNISGGTIQFNGARLLGGEIGFANAAFTGGVVYVDGQAFTKHPVIIPMVQLQDD